MPIEQVLMWIGGQIIAGAAIWGGIRADLRNMHERITQANENATSAHKRIDAHLERAQ